MPSKPRNGVVLEPTIDKYGRRGLRIELIQETVQLCTCENVTALGDQGEKSRARKTGKQWPVT